MPLSTSAKKALRKDRRRTVVNSVIRSKMRTSIRTLRDEKTHEALTTVYSALDRAAKRNVIHKKKAARLKSRLSRLVEVDDSAKKKPTVVSTAPSKRKPAAPKKSKVAKKKA